MSVPDVSGSMPEVSGDVSMPSVAVAAPSASVEGEMPSVDLAGKVPDVPSVEGGISGDIPSADVSVTAPDVKVEGGDASLTAGLAAGGVAALGAVGAAVGLSGDKPEGVDAEVEVPGEIKPTSLPAFDAGVATGSFEAQAEAEPSSGKKKRSSFSKKVKGLLSSSKKRLVSTSCLV